MHGISLLGSQLLVILFFCSYAWGIQLSSIDSDYRRLMYNLQRGATPRRGAVEEYGGGKWIQDPSDQIGSSFEDFSIIPVSSFPSGDYYLSELEKRGSGHQYNFGLGKRSRTYGFGLGKRLEQWKNTAASLNPSYRQERRSKIYSFGLGKRSVNPIYTENILQEDYDDGEQNLEKKSKQFSFGLGKREAISSSNTKSINSNSKHNEVSGNQEILTSSTKNDNHAA